MISFSTQMDTAIGYSNRNNKDLAPCQPEEATHFVWRFYPQLEEIQIPPGSPLPGIYSFRYLESHVNVQTYLNEALARGLLDLAVGGKFPSSPLADHFVAKAPSAGEHVALLIHVPTVAASRLVEGKDERLVANARERGSRDDEWLVYPCDLLSGGGMDARLKMNAHLFLHACMKSA